jgi:hypothetical protein
MSWDLNFVFATGRLQYCLYPLTLFGLIYSFFNFSVWSRWMWSLVYSTTGCSSWQLTSVMVIPTWPQCWYSRLFIDEGVIVGCMVRG